MKKVYIILFAFLAGFIVFSIFNLAKPPDFSSDQPLDRRELKDRNDFSNPPSRPQKNFQAPLPDSAKRITKKPFGKYVEPGNSSVSPERFTGFHTAIDLEAFPEEIGKDMEVRTVCQGELLEKRNAQGYGGVAVQKCLLENQPITVIYGHLKLNSISASPGQTMRAGETLGILGQDKSPETDGERKHLHLGFHRGKEINILGYVPRQEMLGEWIDPCPYVCD